MMISNKKHKRILDHMVKAESVLVSKILSKDKELEQLRGYIDDLLSLSEEEFIEYQVNKIVEDVANSGFQWYNRVYERRQL